MIKTVVKQPEIEFISLIVEIVALVIINQELRRTLFSIVLSTDQSQPQSYLEFLK
jgi:hypothetical protein